MLLFKVFIISFVCIISLNYFVSCATNNEQPSSTQKLQEQHGEQHELESKQYEAVAQQKQNEKQPRNILPQDPQMKLGQLRATKKTATESTIYKIKRLDDYNNGQQEEQREHKQPEYKKDKKKKYTTLKGNQSSMKTEGLKEDKGKKQMPKTKTLKNMAKNSHRLNKKLLSKLGFTKVKAPNSHNRKRLAIESRHHASPDDSHMFIIKLPPNLYYYSSPKSIGDNGNPLNALVPHETPTQLHQTFNDFHNQKQQHQVQEQQQQLHYQQQFEQSEKEVLTTTNGKKVSFPFSSNGKPGRIYHWNLPVIKKILEDKQRFPHFTPATKDAMIDIKDIATWAKPWENETHEKSYGKSSMISYNKKTLKRKSPTYYAPANAVNKNSFNKYFAGNGKPKGFYVIKENQKKPLYYKNIVS